MRELSRRISNRLGTNSPKKKLTPVRLAPDRERLATSPRLTGSSGIAKTIGIVVVAALLQSLEPRLRTRDLVIIRILNSATAAASSTYKIVGAYARKGWQVITVAGWGARIGWQVTAEAGWRVGAYGPVIAPSYSGIGAVKRERYLTLRLLQRKRRHSQ